MNPENLNENLRSISIITISMISGILLFLGVSLFINYTNGPFIKESGIAQTIFYIVMAISLILVVGARLEYDRKISSLKSSEDSAGEKMNDFRAISITHMAMCELPAVVSLICFMIFGNYFFLIPVLISVAEMILRYPSLSKLEDVTNNRIN